MPSTRALTAIAAVALFLAGCSSGPDSSDTPSAPSESDAVTTVTAPPVETAAPASDDQLAGALLVLSDLPVGYEPTPTFEDFGLPEPEEADQSVTDPPGCAVVLAAVAEQVPGATGSAAASFTGGDFQSIDESLASYPSDNVAAAFAAVQKSLGDCTDYSGTDADGYGVTYHVSGGVPFQSTATAMTYRVRTESEGITLTTDAVLAVTGNTIVSVTATGLDAVDTNLFTSLASTAIDRAGSTPTP